MFMGRGLSWVVVACYTCKRCETEGQDLEVSPWLVFCWNCGEQAVITARIQRRA